MKKKLFSDFSEKQNILLPIFAFFLTVFLPIAKIAIILYIILWFVNKEYKQLYKLKYNWFSLFSIAFFSVFALSGLYSNNLILWREDIINKIPLLILPIIFSTKSFSKELVRTSIWALFIGCLVLLLIGFYRLPTEFSSLRTIINKYTSFNIIYYSMYITIVFFFLCYDLWFGKITKFKIIYVFSILIVHYILYGCASRMAILTTFILSLLIVVIWKFIYKRKFFQGVLLISFIILVNSASLSLSKKSTKRFNTLVKGYGDNRVKIWEATWSTIKDSPYFGYGSGDTRAILAPSYLKIGYNLGAKKNVNCHNQYLETWLSTGILGLLIIITWLVISFYKAWKNQNYVFCAFIIIIAMNMLTESILERQHGVFFMVFFGCLLYLFEDKEKAELKKN